MNLSPSAPAPKAGGRVVALSRFRADVSRALVRRGQALLEAADLPDQVAALAPLEAYFIVKELGIEEALPILHVASDAQIQAFIDLDCWSHDRLAVEDLDAWLAAFQSNDPTTLAEAFTRLDPECQVLFLARALTIHDAREEEAALDPSLPTMTTADGTFLLQHRRPQADPNGSDDGSGDGSDDALEGAAAAAAAAAAREVPPFALVEALYQVDGLEAARLLTHARWELDSALEEEALAFRDSRLADLGFPDRGTAMSIFARPPAQPGRMPAPLPASLPGLYASVMGEDSLFVAAMGLIFAHSQLERLEAELVLLCNSAVIAYGHGPRELVYVRQVASWVRDTLGLGLQALGERQADTAPTAAADPPPIGAAVGAALLQSWPLRQIYQWGHAQLMPLRDQARAACRLPHLATWLAAGNAEDDAQAAADRAFLTALTAPQPLWAPTANPADRRAFGTRADLRAAAARLAALAQPPVTAAP